MPDTINYDDAVSIAKELWLDVDFSVIKICKVPPRMPEWMRNPSGVKNPDGVISEEKIELKEYGRYLLGYSESLKRLYVGLWSEV